MSFNTERFRKFVLRSLSPVIVLVGALGLSIVTSVDYISADITTGSEHVYDAELDLNEDGVIDDEEWEIYLKTAGSVVSGGSDVSADDTTFSDDTASTDDTDDQTAGDAQANQPAAGSETADGQDPEDPADPQEPGDPSVTDPAEETGDDAGTAADKEQTDPADQMEEPTKTEDKSEKKTSSAAKKTEKKKSSSAQKNVDTSKTDSENDAAPANLLITPTEADVKAVLPAPQSPIDAGEVTGSRLRQSGKYSTSLKKDYKVEFASDFALIMEEIENEYEYDHKLISEETYEMRSDNLEKGVVFGLDESSSLAKSASEDDMLYLSAEEVDLLLDEEMNEEERNASLTIASYHYTNWADVLAVYAYRQFNAGAKEVVYNEKSKKALAVIFGEMNKTEIVDDENKVAIYSHLTAEEYLADRNLSEEDKDMIKDFTDSSYVLLCAAESGSRQLTISAYDLMDAEAEEEAAKKAEAEESIDEESVYPIPAERKSVVLAAQTLNGKVNYFWGGKYNNLGWNKLWATAQTVSSAGSKDTGSTQLYGLDCSGFVSWAFINGFGDVDVDGQLGQGTASQWTTSDAVEEDDAQVGDLVFLRVPSAGSINHVGILVGRDRNGDWMAIHCNASDDNVVVERAYDAGFRYIRRPGLYSSEEE